MYTEKMTDNAANVIQPEHPMSGTAFTRQPAEETGGVKGRHDAWEKMAVALIFDETNNGIT